MYDEFWTSTLEKLFTPVEVDKKLCSVYNVSRGFMAKMVKTNVYLSNTPLEIAYRWTGEKTKKNFPVD